MTFDISLPSLDEISDRQNLEKIKGYLAALNSQLQYMMLNIDESNLSDSLATTISTTSENAILTKKSVVSLENELSSVSQTADRINWLITDGSDSTDFSLTSYAASLISDLIELRGFVKFSDLQNTGSTFINGGNITTGSISADKLSINDLSSASAKIGGWSVNSTSISSSASGYGSITLNSASSPDQFWIKACDSNGYTTFYIAKSGACYIDGSYISNGSISADKIISDSEYRIDLTNNYRGVKIGKEICLTDGSVNCRLYVNNAGIMTFDTGSGDSAFSFKLNRNGSHYSLSVLNGSGNTVGTISL